MSEAGTRIQVPGGGGAGGYVTIFDQDFSAEANQNLSPDGNYVIGVNTWTKSNSAKDRAAMAIVNGSGLVIQPAQSTYFNLVQDAPTLSIPFSAIGLPNGFTKAAALRISLYVPAINVLNIGIDDAIYFGYDFGTQWGQFTKMGFPTIATIAGYTRWTRNGATAEQGFTGGDVESYNTYKTMVMDVAYLYPQLGNNGHNLLLGPDAAAGWPADSALKPTFSSLISGNVNLSARFLPTDYNTLSLFIAGGAQSPNPANQPTFTIGRIKVEAKV